MDILMRQKEAQRGQVLDLFMAKPDQPDRSGDAHGRVGDGTVGVDRECGANVEIDDPGDEGDAISRVQSDPIDFFDSGYQRDFPLVARRFENQAAMVFGKLFVGVKQFYAINCPIRRDVHIHFIADLDGRDCTTLFMETQIRNIVFLVIAQFHVFLPSERFDDYRDDQPAVFFHGVSLNLFNGIVPAVPFPVKRKVAEVAVTPTALLHCSSFMMRLRQYPGSR